MRLIDISPADQAARIRAAIGYSGKEAKEVAADLGMSEPSLRRRYTPTNPKGVSSMEELHAIAAACGVPPSFMEEGFARYMVGGSVTERIATLEAWRTERSTEARQIHADLDGLSDGLATARQALSDLAGELLEALQGQLGDAAREALEQTQSLAAPASRPARAPGRAA